MNISYTQSVGEAVAEDYRAAAIFEKYGIDFCCKGQTSIDAACASKQVPTETVMRELKTLATDPGRSFPDYQTWSASLLADYIEEKHHRYVEENAPVILRFLDKLCHVHGRRHPELPEIREQFANAAGELTQHMKKEELILFPRIRQMAAMAVFASAPDLGQSAAEIPVAMPIRMMMQEHDREGERFRKIHELSDGYRVPDDACNTYKVTYALLREFENDLHLHIHLENNILFPKAIEMEKKVVH